MPGWLNPEALADLLDELREAGYHVDPSHYIAAQDLILALIAQGERLDDPRRLAGLLGPLLCSSPSEQTDFQGRFARWTERLKGPPHKSPPQDKRVKAIARELRTMRRQSQF